MADGGQRYSVMQGGSGNNMRAERRSRGHQMGGVELMLRPKGECRSSQMCKVKQGGAAMSKVETGDDQGSYAKDGK